MPSKQDRHSPDLDSDLGPDAQPRQFGSHSASSKRHPRSGGQFESGVLLFFGFVCIVGGSALSLMPQFSWKAEQILNGFDHMGIHGGAVAIGGLVLVGLGLVRRQVSSSGKLGGDYEDLLFEQIAADIVLTRGTLDHLQDVTESMQAEIAGLSRDLPGLSREVARLASQPPPQPQVVTGGNDDALYGLAASLDKLGARLEQRIKGQHDALQDHLADMASTLVQVRQSAEAISAQAEQAAHAALVAPIAQPVAHAEPQVAYTEPRVEAPVEHDDAEQRKLGLLDTLDDYGTPAALPQRAPEAAPIAAPIPAPNAKPKLDPEALDELRVHIEQDLGHGQPGNRTWEEELDMIETPAPQSKLDQLHALLADEEVRTALAGFKRSPGKSQSAS